MSDQRRMVRSETPRWRAASEVESPRRRPPEASEPGRMREFMSSLTALWSGFDRLEAALQRFGTQNHPVPGGEAQRPWDETCNHQRVESPPHAPDAPVETQRGQCDRDEHERREHHRAREKACVTRADEDPVEREDA